jgi:hypothetical protein
MIDCQERSGFLFAHACDRPAVYHCTHCAKAICLEHTRVGEAGPMCIGCVATAQPQADSDDDPYFYRRGRDDYHTRSYYDADDRRAFDRTPSSADDDAELETDLGAS